LSDDAVYQSSLPGKTQGKKRRRKNSLLVTTRAPDIIAESSLL